MAKKNLGSMDHRREKEYKGPELPEEYKFIDIIIKGRNIRANLAELMQVKNTENKGEVLNVLNQSASHYFYFSRMKIDLEDALIEEEEKFDLWVASETAKYKEESSEKAKERRLMAEKAKEYSEKKNFLRKLNNYKEQANVAKNAMEKHCESIRSINSTVNKSRVPEPIGDEL